MSINEFVNLPIVFDGFVCKVWLINEETGDVDSESVAYWKNNANKNGLWTKSQFEKYWDKTKKNVYIRATRWRGFIPVRKVVSLYDNGQPNKPSTKRRCVKKRAKIT
jgi:hypothetical protein